MLNCRACSEGIVGKPAIGVLQPILWGQTSNAGIPVTRHNRVQHHCSCIRIKTWAPLFTLSDYFEQNGEHQASVGFFTTSGLHFSNTLSMEVSERIFHSLSFTAAFSALSSASSFFVTGSS